VKAWLSQNRVAFELKDVRRDAEALREFLASGALLPPVVVIDGEVVQGFQPERMEALLLAAEERESGESPQSGRQPERGASERGR